MGIVIGSTFVDVKGLLDDCIALLFRGAFTI